MLIQAHQDLKGLESQLLAFYCQHVEKDRIFFSNTITAWSVLD